MKHTPGPWEITKEWLSIQAYPPGNVVRICTNPQGGIGELYTHNWRANAPLIAAAPELLAACQMALELSGHADGCRWFDIPLSRHGSKQSQAEQAEACDCHLKALRAAIAKATRVETEA